MLDPVTLAAIAPLFAKACGSIAGDLLQNAAEKHVETFFGKAYERQVEKQKIGDDSLREELVAELLAESLQVQKERLGVRPEVSEARYAARMREKYQVLDLTALQSPTVDDPGPLHLQKVFLPQDVREDPPPVELPKDLLQRMLDEGEWAPGVECS